ncbi:MAG: glutamine--fructose-6-phosphate transaminase (isomerizing) [Acidobacteriota bacterium]
MCGIVGYVGKKQVADILMDGLKRLEYRGYDSAGIAVVENGVMNVRRSLGKIRLLEELLIKKPIKGDFGVGHTRWATHGKPSEENAHPHRDCTGKLVVVHNGIIENYLELKQELTAKGHKFQTETDTEIIAHLIESNLTNSLEQAVFKSLPRLKGAYAIALISTEEPQRIIAARFGPPLIIGVGNGENFVASDIPAILHYTKNMIFLADGEIAIVDQSSVVVKDVRGKKLKKEVMPIAWDPIMAEKGGYKHFMLKEIHEQPRAMRDTIYGRISLDSGAVFLNDIRITEKEFKSFKKINIIACGTSLHAGLVGKFLIEELARIPVEVDYGSEFRYRDPIITRDILHVVISQSGETADTLAALREAKQKKSKSIAICNVVGSMLTREATGTIYTHAGPEIGVASTKAFISQIAAQYLLALYLGKVRGHLTEKDVRAHGKQLMRIPAKMEELLRREGEIEELAKRFYTSKDFLFLGRGINYPIALEGALKLKEISYIHAEGYPAGEMKHGPIALIDENFPVVAVAVKDRVYEKILSNIEEVKARSGIVIALTNGESSELEKRADHIIQIPETLDLLNPLLLIIPLQLLAYYIALKLGCDVDQPRNLAKSVTVE